MGGEDLDRQTARLKYETLRRRRLVRATVSRISPPGFAAPPFSAAVMLADDDLVWRSDDRYGHCEVWIDLTGSKRCGASSPNSPRIQSGMPS